MRGNRNKAQETLHVVSAWSREEGMSFSQKSVNGKGKGTLVSRDNKLALRCNI